MLKDWNEKCSPINQTWLGESILDNIDILAQKIPSMHFNDPNFIWHLRSEHSVHNRFCSF